MVLDPEIGFGDAYMQGRIEVKGDLVHALEGGLPRNALGRETKLVLPPIFKLAAARPGQHLGRIGFEHPQLQRG
jgi:hypothetical protein